MQTSIMFIYIHIHTQSNQMVALKLYILELIFVDKGFQYISVFVIKPYTNH